MTNGEIPIHFFIADMSYGAKLLWIRLRGYESMKEKCIRPSRRRLAAEIGSGRSVTMRQISHWTNELETAGWLAKHKRVAGGKVVRTYELMVPETGTGVVPETGTGVVPETGTHVIRGGVRDANARAASAALGRNGHSSPVGKPKRMPTDVIRSKHKCPSRLDPYVQLSKQLADAIYEKEGHDIRKMAIPHAKSLRMLHEVEKAQLGDITRTVQWYCDEVRAGRMLPHVNCTSMFRTKYLQLRKRMEEQIKRDDPAAEFPAPTAKNLNLQLERYCTEDIHDTMRHLSSRVARRDVAMLFAVVQDWSDRMWKQRPRANEPGSYCWESMFRPSAGIVQVFAAWVRRYIDGWERWSGRMDGFYPGGKHFAAFLDEWGRECEWTEQVKRRIEGLGRCVDAA